MVRMQPTTNQRWQHRCATVSRRRDDTRPYVGASVFPHTTHVQVYFGSVIRQCMWEADHGFITLGATIIQQLTIPQGGCLSPLMALCVTVVHILNKIRRLTHYQLQAPPQSVPPHIDLGNMMRACVVQQVDDLLACFPYLLGVPATLVLARNLMLELHHGRPPLTGQVTFTLPLVLEVQGV